MGYDTPDDHHGDLPTRIREVEKAVSLHRVYSIGTINDLADEIHSWAVGKGWWEEDNRNFGEMIALVHSECSEALEEWRDHGYDQPLYYKEDKQGNQKPEGIAIELADIIIRVLDLTASLDLDIAEALEIKMAYNETRAHRHGGKLA